MFRGCVCCKMRDTLLACMGAPPQSRSQSRSKVSDDPNSEDTYFLKDISKTAAANDEHDDSNGFLLPRAARVITRQQGQSRAELPQTTVRRHRAQSQGHRSYHQRSKFTQTPGFIYRKVPAPACRHSRTNIQGKGHKHNLQGQRLISSQGQKLSSASSEQVHLYTQKRSTSRSHPSQGQGQGQTQRKAYCQFFQRQYERDLLKRQAWAERLPLLEYRYEQGRPLRGILKRTEFVRTPRMDELILVEVGFRCLGVRALCTHAWS